MHLKATVLTDNIPSGSLGGEWGLSVWIEYGGSVILLDAGASGLWADNARKLGLDPADVDCAVLSHAHYDHSDGFRRFFTLNDRAKLYLRRECGESCVHRYPTYRKYIGIRRGLTSRFSGRIVRCDGIVSPLEGVSLLPHTAAGLEEVGRREHMERRIGGKWAPDDFAHEQSLVLELPDGIVLMNSCCHAGAATVVREAMEVFPDRPVLAVIGGFHLFNKRDDEVLSFAADLKATGVRSVYTGHCTGPRALGILQRELGGDVVHPLHAGLVMSW